MTRNLREHILLTASDLFYRQGIKATGVDAIVKASGVAKMSLYKYFPSKDDLVLAHLRKSGESLTVRILTGIEARSSQPWEQLLAIFEVFEELLQSPEFRGCPFINASAEFAEQAGPVQQASAEFYQGFISLMTNLARQAGVNDAEELARQLAMLVAGAIVSEQMQRHSGAMKVARAGAKDLIEKRLTQGNKGDSNA